MLWGTRGSLPVSGDRAGRYGGNTICIEVRAGPHSLYFDAGSGIAAAADDFAAAGRRHGTLFLSHAHYDHLIGLPFFRPLWDRGVTFAVWSGMGSTVEVLKGFMRAPYFPIGPEVFCAGLTCHDFAPWAVLEPFPDLTVRTAPLNHPGGSTGYRVEWQGRSVALVTDTEHDPARRDPAVMALAAGADLMLYDAAYEDAEFARVCGYGHSTWEEGVRLAKAAGVRRLGLIHHAEWRGPAELARIGRAARAAFPAAFMGRDGMVIDL